MSFLVFREDLREVREALAQRGVLDEGAFVGRALEKGPAAFAGMMAGGFAVCMMLMGLQNL